MKRKLNMKPNQIIAALVLATAAASAGAAPVTVTADFTGITMGGFYSGAHAYAAGLSANGQSIDVCGGDPNCVTAMNNPGSVSASLAGGNSVTFGYDPNLFPTARMNVLTFTGNTAADVTGANPFTLGTFTFTNGAFHPLAFLNFTLTTHSSDAAYDNHTFTGRIRLDTNSTDGYLGGYTDPEAMAEADYFTVQDSAGSTLTSLGSVRVYDYSACLVGDPTAPACNTGSVDVIGHIASLHLDSFANPTGGAFINSSTTSTLNPTAAVPEPEIYAMLLAGLGLLGFSARRQKNRMA